jgi:predicted enzyme related to lactoylglutathione lyase
VEPGFDILPDCVVEEERAKKNGGSIEKGEMSIGEYGYISLVYDTEGNMIGLHSLQSIEA